MGVEDDRELVKAAHAGDRGALATLLKRFGPQVRGMIAPRIPARWRSLLSEDDVMQQTYADAALSIRSFSYLGEGSITAWLAALARYNLVDAIRALEAEKRGGGRRKVELPEDGHASLFAALAVTHTTPSRHARQDETRSALEAALQRLPPHYRQAVEWHDLQGLPVEEAAARLGRSRGAFYMLRARALEQLAVELGSASAFLTRRA